MVAFRLWMHFLYGGRGAEDLQLLHHHESWLRRACWTAGQLKGFVPHSGHDGARLCALISIFVWGRIIVANIRGTLFNRSDCVNMCCMKLWTCAGQKKGIWEKQGEEGGVPINFGDKAMIAEIKLYSYGSWAAHQGGMFKMRYTICHLSTKKIPMALQVIVP